MGSTPASPTLDAAPDAPCDHAWCYRKPAHVRISIRVCQLCDAIDGQDLANTLNEHVTLALKEHGPKPVELLYGHSDGIVFSRVDKPGGIPDTARERAILRALLTHTLEALEQAEITAHLPTATLVSFEETRP